MTTRKGVTRPLACSLALFTAVALPGAVLAQEYQGSGVRTLKVHYGDLNLSTTAGASTLYLRIRGAAREVCGNQGDKYGLDASYYWDGCFQSAVNGAVEKIHSPLLTALHRRGTAETAVTAMIAH